MTAELSSVSSVDPNLATSQTDISHALIIRSRLILDKDRRLNSGKPILLTILTCIT
jgi:hypothetical protein